MNRSASSPELGHDSRVWTKAQFMECASRYAQVVSALLRHLRVTRTVVDTADPSEADVLAALLVRLFVRASRDRCLGLIKSLIEGEFESKLGSAGSAGGGQQQQQSADADGSAQSVADQQGAVMRGNTLASKISGQFVRQVAIEYVRKTVAPLVESVLRDPKLDLEVDPHKVGCQPTDEAVLGPRRELLARTAQSFLDRITSANMLQDMPRQVRAICGITRSLAGSFGLSEPAAYALVGGFVMLRVFSPALVTPESWGVVEDPPNTKARRNLVLIVKLLQNASNGVAFSSKESFMIPFNSFVEGNRMKMNAYLAAAAADPLDMGWQDVNKAAESDPKIEFDITKFDMQDLFEIHRQIHQMKQKLVPALLRLKKEASAPQVGGWASGTNGAFKEWIDSSIAAFQQLGPPPVARKRTSNQKAESGTNSVVSRAKAPGEALLELEKCQWLYWSGENRRRQPVVYAVISRLDPSFICDENIQFVMAHIMKIMDSIATRQPFAVCVDMSYARLAPENRRLLYRRFSEFRAMLPQTYHKNLSACYLVHPNPITRSMLYYIRPFTSFKLRGKIFECYSWKGLDKHIETALIALPTATTDYITKGYTVTKINARDKRQERLIKFTLHSLLNIDPKSRKIQNERNLSEIDEIMLSRDETSERKGEEALVELRLKFDPDAVAMNKKRMMKSKGVLATKLNKQMSSADLERRRYTCHSADDREDIMVDIFSCGFAIQCQVAATKLPQEYRVVKYNPANKPQDRVFKLTQDSLLNLDPSNRKIKTEIPFAAIASVELGSELPDLLWLHFKTEETPRKILCKDFATQLCQALQDCLRRFQLSEEFDEDQEKALIASVQAEIYSTRPNEPVVAIDRPQAPPPVQHTGYGSASSQSAAPAHSTSPTVTVTQAPSTPQSGGGGWARVTPSRKD